MTNIIARARLILNGSRCPSSPQAIGAVMDLHLRGNTEAFMRAGSPQKWLEFHGDTHWTHFYTNYGLDLQKRFFGHFLKGEQTGWEHTTPCPTAGTASWREIRRAP